MTDRRHVDADLMRAPGLETAGDEACRAERLLKPPMGERVAATRLIDDRHLFPMARMSADRRRHLAGPDFKAAPNQREVFSFERARAAVIGEEFGEALMRRVRLGGDEKAGGVFIEPVHDARPLHSADAQEARPAMADQRVDEGAGRMAGRRMNDEFLPACR